VVSHTFHDSNIPKVHVTLLDSTKKNISLCINHPCGLFDNYGDYSHHCTHLEDFHNTLQVLHELEATRSDSTSPLPLGYGPTIMPRQGFSQPTIMISPPDFDMTNSSAPILYLLSSIGSIY